MYNVVFLASVLSVEQVVIGWWSALFIIKCMRFSQLKTEFEQRGGSDVMEIAEDAQKN